MIDFHAHSTMSDGSDTPTQVIQKAKEIGLAAIALTDHDSIDGLDEARIAAKELNINLINGIEFSTRYDKNRLIHLLALGFDPEHPAFLEPYMKYRRTRDEKISNTIEKLNEMNIPITREGIEKIAKGRMLHKHFVARWLVKHNFALTITNAWIDIIDQISYLEEELMQPQQVFDMVKASGGKTVLAHYTKPIGLCGYSKEERIRRLEELKDMGLDGIERYYPTFTPQDINEADEYIEKIGLLPCGGTDYHGSNRAGNELGVGDGTFCVPDNVYTAMF